METSFLAFTIDNLVGKDENSPGLLDVLNNYETAESASPSELSIGWLMRLGTREDGKVDLPYEIVQLVLMIKEIAGGQSTDGSGNTTGGSLKLDFEFASIDKGFSAAVSTGNNSTMNRPAPFNPRRLSIDEEPNNSVTNNGSKYINSVKFVDTFSSSKSISDPEFEYASPYSKAVFFSRTQLLLAREFIKYQPPGENRTLLFSGCQYAVGRMGARRNMMELENLAKDRQAAAQVSFNRQQSGEANNDPGVERWFSLKAEVFSDEIVQPLADNQFEQIKLNLDTDRLIHLIQTFKNNSGNFPLLEGYTLTGNIEPIQTYGPTGIDSAQARVEQQAAMAPYMYFGQPCPPGWIPADEANHEVTHMVRNAERSAGKTLKKPYKTLLYSYLKEVFEAIGENDSSNIPSLLLAFEDIPFVNPGSTHPGSTSPLGPNNLDGGS